MSWKNHSSGSSSNSDAGEVLRIYHTLTPKPDDLIRQGRKFIKEGDVQVWSVKERMKKNRHLFLFNDVLLITKKEGSKKFWLKVYISLRSGLKIQDVTDSTNERPDVEFRIYAPKKTFILFGFNPSHKFEWINAIQGQIDQNEGKVESVKKERIDSLYQAPPTQPSFDNDQFDFDPRGSVAVAPAFQQQQQHQSFDMGGAPHHQQQHHQSSAFSALPEPIHEEPAEVPVLPPPPGMKRESGVVARDPFAAGGNDPFASLGGPAVNPYAPQGFAQPDPFGQPQMINPHASVINPYGQAPINPYAPPLQQQPINPHASVINPYAQQQPNPYAPNPYGQPQQVVDPRGSVYNAPPLQPKPLPTPGGGGSGFGGGMPGLPPKPAQYTPLAQQQQQQQPDPFASLLPALPAKPLPSKAGPPAGARDPFGGDDDFESFARRSGQQPGPHDNSLI